MRLLLAGDVGLFGRNSVCSSSFRTAYFDKLRVACRSHDIAVANLEVPFSVSKKQFGIKSAHLHSDPQDIELLSSLGFTHVCLANNHIGDYGVEGYVLTKELLDKAGIGWFGIEGREIRIAQEGAKIALSGYCSYNTNPLFMSTGKEPGINVLDVETVRTRAKANQLAGFLNIIAVHSGQEHIDIPSTDDITFARALAKDVDYVYYGHHPHVVQGFEQIGKSKAFYSLGNLIFDDVYSQRSRAPIAAMSDDNRSGLLVSLRIKGSELAGCEIFETFLGESELFVRPKAESDYFERYNKWLESSPSVRETERQRQIEVFLSGRKSRRDLAWYLKRLRPSSFTYLRNAKNNSAKYRHHFSDKLQLFSTYQ